MNQSQLISSFVDMGYRPSVKRANYTLMTCETSAGPKGQVVHKDGTILTLRSTDAVRAINNEEINMSTYYTKTQLENMTEKERTALYNDATGSTVARMRNKGKAVDAILAVQEQEKPDVVKVSQHNTDTTPHKKEEVVKRVSIKQKVRDLLLLADTTAYSIEELCAHTGGTKTTVQTALSDLKSDKYCGAGGKLNIMKTKNKSGDSAFTIHV